MMIIFGEDQENSVMKIIAKDDNNGCHITGRA